MGKIRILDENIANIIAAGEVVENPASMIKELIENSLDAKAKNIRIDVRNNGRDVRIKDDGVGMEREDLFLSIERHATSKIREKDDIFNIQSYGFRGEALASISAISKLRIESKRWENELGNLITVKGGRITKHSEVSCGDGTLLEIKDLFFNTPARLKFLRKKSTEYSKLKEIVSKEALYNTEVSFVLTLDGREVLKTSGKGRENTILEIFGMKTLKNIKEFDLGYWGNMELLRSGKEGIITFVNGRYVKSQTLEKAVIDSYYTKLGKGKYPFAIIFYEIDPREVDVNVHPSKKIVKFVDEKKVYKEVMEKLEKGIYEDDRSNSMDMEGKIDVVDLVSKDEKTDFLEEETKKFNIKNPEETTKETMEVEKGVEAKATVNKIENKRFVEKQQQEQQKSFIDLSGLKNMLQHNVVDEEATKTATGEKIPEKSMEERLERARKNSQVYEEYIPEPPIKNSIKSPVNNSIENPREDYRVIGQMRNMYILVETPKELEIYDQHIVHERILYEKLKEEHYNKKISTQALLVSKKLDLSMKEVGVALENKELLKEFGFVIEEFGIDELVLREVPIFDFRIGYEEMFKKIISVMDGRDPRESVIISMSCRNAIKAGQELTMEEMENLLRELHKIGKYSCPHGRPIILKLGNDEVDKKFQRK